MLVLGPYRLNESIAYPVQDPRLARLLRRRCIGGKQGLLVSVLFASGY